MNCAVFPVCQWKRSHRTNVVQVLSEIKGGTLLQNVFSEGKIVKSPEALYEENMINMRLRLSSDQVEI
jgi:hypothetical protein